MANLQLDASSRSAIPLGWQLILVQHPGELRAETYDYLQMLTQLEPQLPAFLRGVDPGSLLTLVSGLKHLDHSGHNYRWKCQNSNQFLAHCLWIISQEKRGITDRRLYFERGGGMGYDSAIAALSLTLAKARCWIPKMLNFDRGDE